MNGFWTHDAIARLDANRASEHIEDFRISAAQRRRVVAYIERLNDQAPEDSALLDVTDPEHFTVALLLLLEHGLEADELVHGLIADPLGDLAPLAIQAPGSPSRPLRLVRRSG